LPQTSESRTGCCVGVSKTVHLWQQQPTIRHIPERLHAFRHLGVSAGPPCYQKNPITGVACTPGENWAANGGGIWMSAKGPSSDIDGGVFLGAGNGPFACTLPSSQQCTVAANIRYWGESAMIATRKVKV
jgi:hypothetical protein